MKNRILVFLLFFTMAGTASYSQSSTTEALHKRYSDARSFFFYNNTLRMLNQKEDKEFDELIKDIEKMKFLMIHKTSPSFNYKKLVGEYKAESFEEAMTSRHEGKSFDIFIQEKNGKTKGMLVLVNTESDLYVLDIVGSIALNKVAKLYSTLDNSSDIGKTIREFSSEGNKDEKDGKDNK